MRCGRGYRPPARRAKRPPCERAPILRGRRSPRPRNGRECRCTYQRMFAPLATARSGVSSERLPASSSAHKIMPSDSKATIIVKPRQFRQLLFTKNLIFKTSNLASHFQMISFQPRNNIAYILLQTSQYSFFSLIILAHIFITRENTLPVRSRKITFINISFHNTIQTAKQQRANNTRDFCHIALKIKIRHPLDRFAAQRCQRSCMAQQILYGIGISLQ